jgi:excisionase family DNA binding protein
MEELWDIARVAEYLGVSERTVYNRVRAGELPAIKMGRLWRVRPSELERWLATEHPRSENGEASVPAGIVEPASVPRRADLDAAVDASQDQLVRRLSFVAQLTLGVEALGWPAPVVVGGHAVEFYTAGSYPTQDIDLAGASEPVAEVLATWGFERHGRHWFDERLGIVVEVPGSALTLAAREHLVSVKVGGGVANILGIEDLIVDRLAACIFWKDEESCRWARVLLKGAAELDEAYLSERVREEQLADAFVSLSQDSRR